MSKKMEILQAGSLVIGTAIASVKTFIQYKEFRREQRSFEYTSKMQHPAWASDAAGIKPGSSFEELEAAHGPLEYEWSVVYERWEATMPEGILVVVDLPEPGGTVVLMDAGPFICGE